MGRENLRCMHGCGRDMHRDVYMLTICVVILTSRLLASLNGGADEKMSAFSVT